jgi:hypothetical protein
VISTTSFGSSVLSREPEARFVRGRFRDLLSARKVEAEFVRGLANAV